MAKPKVFVRAPFNYDVDEASAEAGLECRDPSRAVQSDAEDADINTIVRRFGLTGVLPNIPMPPTYADLTEAPDFQTAQNLIVEARESFMMLPADVRMRFNNDAFRFVEYCENPENLPELRKMGLAVPEKVEDSPRNPA